MPSDTLNSIASSVLLRVPSANILLAQDWVNDAFRRIAERRCWSWLVKYNEFLTPAQYVTGTVTLVHGSATVVGSGTTWTVDMVGRQFRIGLATPIYTIASWSSATEIELELPWGGASISGTGYVIYGPYVTPPNDFHALLSVWDPTYNWQLQRNVTQQELNTIDAQRANSGQSYCVASLDYTQSQVGAVAQPVQSVGSGPVPISGGQYSGPSNALFTVQVTTGGASGTAEYKWKKGGGSYTTGVVTDTLPFELQDGVQIAWPTETYVLNDVFVISATAGTAAGVPRFELWPHQYAQYCYPYLYESRCVPLKEGGILPRFIRPDLLMEMGLAQAARWPGPADKPNPYFNLGLADRIEASCERMIMELERQDDETYEAQVSYAFGLPFFTPFGDAKWVQAHAI